MLRVDGIETYYGSIRALSGVTLDVSPGTIVTILGPNGAGKTTTLKTIAGLLRPARGAVRYQGRRIDRLAPDHIVRLGISLVPERRELFPEMTVEENFIMGAYSRSDRRRVREDLEETFALFPELRSRRGQVAETLSGGQQQMVAIGQALMAKPRMLMLDEPTSGLSLIVIRDILDALERLRADGLGLLFVEQSVPRALAHSDRCYVMERGRVVLAGPSSQLVDNDDVYAIVRGTREALAHG
jgi:branched-chain amino acid transport system ATP-binding protein